MVRPWIAATVCSLGAWIMAIAVVEAANDRLGLLGLRVLSVMMAVGAATLAAAWSQPLRPWIVGVLVAAIVVALPTALATALVAEFEGCDGDAGCIGQVGVFVLRHAALPAVAAIALGGIGSEAVVRWVDSRGADRAVRR